MSQATDRDQSPELPGHTAIVMDGNGRWAQEHGLARIRGHEKGADSVRKITTRCAELGLEELTLYAFSMDNWKRPQKEVEFLMDLLRTYLKKELDTIMENDIQFRTIGRVQSLPDSSRELIRQTEEKSSDNSGMILRLALNYSGQKEVVDACRTLLEKYQGLQQDPSEIDLEELRNHMYDPDMSEPDLLIRTGGEQRISDFLLFHLSYTEIYFTETYWPEFRSSELSRAFEEFRSRNRRFGGLNEDST